MSVRTLVEEFSALEDPRCRGKVEHRLINILLIDTWGFERGFAAWARSFGAPVDRDVVAIDGKTIRGFFDRGREQGPLHVVSAWACDRRLVLGQRQIGDKSNEITAIPELLTALDLKGAIVTLDAMGCQRAIATRILKRGADYLVVLKANQGKKFTAVQELCAATCSAARRSTGWSMTNLMMATAAWFGAACSSARRLPRWNRCATGPACRPS